jgi:hypothetical protein
MLGARDDHYKIVTRVDVKVTESEVCLLQHVALQFTSEVTEGERRSFEACVSSAVRDKLDNKLDLVELRGSEETKRRLRIAVNFDIAAFPPSVCSMIRPLVVNTGHTRANAERLLLSSGPGAIAHEFAHRILAAEDEYHDAESRHYAPERRVRWFELEEADVGKGSERLMRSHRDGVLFPSNAAAIANILEKVLSGGDGCSKFSVAFAPHEKPRDEFKRYELSRIRFNREVRRRAAVIEDKFAEMGWVERVNAANWTPKMRPVLFRELISNYVAARDELASSALYSLEREQSPSKIFINYVAERIGYEKFRGIAIPDDGHRQYARKHAFENKVIRNLAISLSDTSVDPSKRPD